MIMEPDIYTSITELAAVYETLNERLESDPCTTDAYQVCCQQTYRDAYAALQAMPVEPIALRLIAEGISDRVLTRLRDLIRKNIHICETRKEFFRQVDFCDLCRLQEDYLFAGKRTSLLNDRKEIGEYPYPTEREREELLQENRAALNELDNERAAYRRENAGWIGRDYYTAINEMSCFSASVLDSYFPVEKKTITVVPTTMESADQPTEFKSISPDEIFRSRMFDKFRELEKRLIKSGDLGEDLHWQAKHKNDKPDIKRLVAFLAGLIDHDYFLPNRDTSIKRFFEERYRIPIGQNFERRRREPLMKIYRTIFYDLPF